MWWDFKLHFSWCQSLSGHDEWTAVLYVSHCFHSSSHVTVCPPVCPVLLSVLSSCHSPVHDELKLDSVSASLRLSSSCKTSEPSAETVHTHRLSGQNSGCSSLLPCSRNTVMSKEFTSEYGGAPRVISSHSNTPKDHCRGRGVKLFSYATINTFTFTV